MKMFFIFVGLMFYLWIFLENFWLPIIMLFFFAWGIAFAVFFIRKKGIPEKVIGVSTGLNRVGVSCFFTGYCIAG